MEGRNSLTASVGALAGEVLPRIAAAQSVSAPQATSFLLRDVEAAWAAIWSLGESWTNRAWICM